MEGQRSSRWAQAAALAGVCGCIASAAHAHAPQARSVALSADASSIALALPGFGILLRAGTEQPFAYLCDALLGAPPSELAPAMVFAADGSLLVGSRGGLRIVDATGCPTEQTAGELRDAVVLALAVTRGAIYALTSGTSPGLWRSRDDGQRWELRGPLDGAERVTALRVDADDPESVYLSQGMAEGGSTLLVSSDGGSSFSKIAEERALTLLHAQRGATEAGTSSRLWALARDPQGVANRGFEIVRAEQPEGPWRSQLRIQFFGGFSVDAAGVITVGDEGGGIYRSTDGGDTFENLGPKEAVACLADADGALWACKPGTAEQPALVRKTATQPAFESVVAFSEVQSLVACGGEFAVAQRCGAAWLEWQRDVLMRDLAAPEAGLPDAGPSLPPAADASAPLDAAAMFTPASSADARAALAPEPVEVRPEPSGCAASDLSVCAGSSRGASRRPLWLVLSLLVLTLAARRSARARL